MKVSDYIADFLAKKGITHVFLVSGGAAVHMVDSVSKHPRLQAICSGHEQGAGTEADGYARISRNIGAAVVTSGPGPTNLVTSIANCWYDSIPTLFLCGQVATFRIKKSPSLRQKGFQETDTASLFSSLTKYVGIVRDAKNIRFELEKAYEIARSGRPGPVVLDIPDDIQREEIELETLRKFEIRISKYETNSKSSNSKFKTNDEFVGAGFSSPIGEPKSYRFIGREDRAPTTMRLPDLSDSIKKVFFLLQSSKRPVIIFGAGVRVAKAEKEAIRFARYFHIPVLLTWGGADLMDYSDPLNMGVFGAAGPRAGNFTVQSSDCILAIGTRLSQLITGGKQNLFAPTAAKIMVDIDRVELDKFTEKEFLLKLAICADAKEFFAVAIWTGSRSGRDDGDRFESWRKQIQSWRKQFPICPPQYYKQRSLVNPYVFIKALSAAAKVGDIVVGDTGANLAWTMQAFEVKKGQRIISGWNHTPMGYALPASIGAAVASGRRVLCLTGDGGFLMCLSEMATLARHKLNIKIFLFNNHGHAIQRQTLDTWLNSRYTAVDVPSGLSFPDFPALSESFGIPSVTIRKHSEMKKVIASVLKRKGPVLCNVEIDPRQKIVPYLRYGAPLEDMEPRLQKEELQKIMSIS